MVVYINRHDGLYVSSWWNINMINTKIMNPLDEENEMIRCIWWYLPANS